MSTESEKARIIQTWISAISAKDVNGCSELCTEDTWVRYSSSYGPDLNASGRECIEENLREWFEGFDSIKFTNLESSVETDLAFSLDSWEIDPEKFQKRDFPFRLSGKVVSIYKRQSDDIWKCRIVTFMDNFWNYYPESRSPNGGGIK